MLGNRSVRVTQSCWWSNSALMDEAREASWRENIPAGNRSAGLLDGFEFNRKLKLRCLSPQKLFGSHESSSVQLWVSYNRQPMKAARFMTRHPITVSPITKCWCQGMLRVGTSWTFFFFRYRGPFCQTSGCSSMNELLAQAHNPITSDLEMYVYNSWIESYREGLRLFWL